MTIEKKRKSSLTLLLFKERFVFLLISLLGLIVLLPLIENFIKINILINLFISAVLISCIHAVSNNRRLVIICTLFAIPWFFASWCAHFSEIHLLSLMGNISGIFFIAFTVIAILLFIFNQNKVDTNIIYASIVVYLLLAVMFGYVFNVIETLMPGSFAIGQTIKGKSQSVFTYYSFVTITTLGFGDITPLTKIARAFSMLEAVIGQIYLVVLVARLVGINISQSMVKK